MARFCREHGVRLLVLYLPPPYCAQREINRDDLEAYRRVLGFTDEQIAVSDRIADRWLAFLDERGIAHLDLRPLMRATPERLYYRADHHLNVRGHQVVADAILPEVRRLLQGVDDAAGSGGR